MTADTTFLNITFTIIGADDYYMYYWEDDKPAIRFNTSEPPPHNITGLDFDKTCNNIITGLDPDTTFNIVIVTFNSAGSKNSSIIDVKTMQGVIISLAVYLCVYNVQLYVLFFSKLSIEIGFDSGDPFYGILPMG